MNKTEEQRVLTLVERLFGDDEQGEPRFQDQELLSCVPFLLDVLGAQDDPLARPLLQRFVRAAKVEGLKEPKERAAAFAKYCEANPPAPGVVKAIADFVREQLASGDDDARARAERALGTSSGQAVLSALAQDGPGQSPLQTLLAARLKR